MAGKDFYQILGVTLEATQKEIKHAYRLLARKYHPDVSSVRNAEEKFKTMGEAYEVLKNPTKRSEYDRQYRQRSQTKARSNSSTKPNTSSRQNHSTRARSSSKQKRSYAFNEAEFNERHAAELNSFYGDQFGFNKKKTRSNNFNENNFNLDGRDIHARVFIDLEHSLNGTSQQFNVQIPVYTPQGDLINKSKFLNVRIPRGVRAGDIIRLAKQGSPGMGAAAGDFLIEVVFNPHEFYTIEGSDIYMNLQVTPEQLKRGESISINSPNPRLGKITMAIPKGSKSGSQLHFAGHGIPNRVPGDLLITLQTASQPKENINSNMHYQQDYGL